MEIRTLKIEDYDSLIALWESANLPYKPQGRDSKREMKRQIECDSDLMLGAFEDGNLIGVIFGTDDGRKGWINRLAVEPSHERKGLAKKLILAVEDALRARGRKIICTLIEDWNKGSLILFKKMDYVKHEDIFYLSKREDDDV
ncbi:MAG: GNAT family N-acetyltransferase [Thermoplasmata archaeon]|nr:MAG: GNAT family N-acetyltransferase [Thermoplasmata archaeon]